MLQGWAVLPALLLDPWGMARVWYGYGSREGKECALHLSMWPRYGTGMARDCEGMARDIAAGIEKDVVGYGTALVP